ncbi:calcium-dependent protein kinase 22-like [Helianthus annuus]|uniref:calcium-dependent protein kinase 22-like n=1 Tax=Helianthus annuus TaxID=4232 RepID=UPI000B907985|nr:calcium-dependent protein kinase 22-like [Helianthus annuus]
MADKGKKKITIKPITFRDTFPIPAIGQLSLDETCPRTVTNSLKEKGYTLGGSLGKGSFGKVYKCIEDATGQAFVCKITLTRKNDIEMAIREMDIMKGLSAHPNLVAWKDGISDAHAIVIVVELCQGGTLWDHMKNKVSYTEEFYPPSFVRSLEEAHEKLKSSLKLKERGWDIENYETSKQRRELDHMFERLKEEKVKVEEQLKMKSSLFNQLEENYEMLRVKENEWGIEKRAFCGEISILERKLDSL